MRLASPIFAMEQTDCTSCTLLDAPQFDSASRQSMPLGGIGEAADSAAQQAAAIDPGIPKEQAGVQENRHTDIRTIDSGVEGPERSGTESDDGKPASAGAGTQSFQGGMNFFQKRTLVEPGDVRVRIAVTFADACEVHSQRRGASRSPTP